MDQTNFIECYGSILDEGLLGLEEVEDHTDPPLSLEEEGFIFPSGFGNEELLPYSSSSEDISDMNTGNDFLNPAEKYFDTNQEPDNSDILTTAYRKFPSSDSSLDYLIPVSQLEEVLFGPLDDELDSSTVISNGKDDDSKIKNEPCHGSSS
jgi:hypothetical protein